MQLIDGAPVYSATDLVGFLACEHLANLERAAVAGLTKRPMRADPELDRIAKRGLQHEQRFLAGLRANGCSIAEITRDESLEDRGEQLRRQATETLAAMRAGVDVIYQATFFQAAMPGGEGGAGRAVAGAPDAVGAGPTLAGAPETAGAGDAASGGAASLSRGAPGHAAPPVPTWLGFADFLRRVETPSDLGAWSYEVWDTKLARHTKASAILQLCLYTDCLERLQGVRPAEMHVALGGSKHAVEHHRTADYLAYYRAVRSRFEGFVTDGPPAFPPATRPDPAEHCEVCRWQVDCNAWRRANDDLSLVANISAKQRRALREHLPPIASRRALAGAALPLDPPLPRRSGVREEGLRTVHAQARIQVAGEDAGRVLYELLDPNRVADGTLEPNRGLLSLPAPSHGDLFFDIEGDPFAFDDGVDYLFGVIEPNPPADAPAAAHAEETALRAEATSLPAAGRPDVASPDLRRPVSPGGPASGTVFHAIWSFDAAGQVTPAAEKAAFERLVDVVVERRARDPDLHVYHYASYEPTALGRLSERYHTREDEVDALLRGGVFVDLFRAVRQGLRASVESYSIKKLEPLYGFTREIELRDAGSSIVAFETWLELGDDEAAQGPEILARIAGYNRDDCVSTLQLRDWLEVRRPELAAKIEMEPDALPRPVVESSEPAEALSDYLARVAALEDRLAAGIPPDRLADPASMHADEHARWLLAQLLAWHRREDKSAWWRYFELMKLTDEELVLESDALGGLEPAGEPRPERKSLVYRYRFPEQEHDIQPGTDVYDPATGDSPGDVVAVDNVAGWIELKRGPKRANAQHPRSLVPREIVGTPEQRESLLRVGAWVAEHGIDADGDYRAARDILLRRPPRLHGEGKDHAADPEGDAGPGRVADPRGDDAARRVADRQGLAGPGHEADSRSDGARPATAAAAVATRAAAQLSLDWHLDSADGAAGAPSPDAAPGREADAGGHEAAPRGVAAPLSLRHPAEPGAAALRRLAPLLDHSYLAVQGPPGSGKTTAGAELIVDLVDRGCRVGVTANSHKVIGNLLDRVAEKARERGATVRIGQKPASGDDPACKTARCMESNDELRDALGNREIDVAGATAWAWSRADMAGSLDLLVVDEAGQVSLANVVAVAPAADSLVLLGDPQQLDQPLKGSHPPGAERSALGHLLGDAKTMPDALGLLLESTWRLHPDICAYTSEVFYDGRLGSGEGTERQALEGPGLLAGTGIRFVAVDHAGDRNSSAEEASLISDLLGDLLALGGTWTDPKGRTHPLGLTDAVVITPYNAQVRDIARRGPRDSRVGTVDKFQGQEAPISIYSMATSSAAEAPRGMEFLYSLNRLNVASSRARCLTLVVASPELIRVQCRTPRQMRLANALARLVEVGEQYSPRTRPK